MKLVYWLATGLLAPVLLLQGGQVRRRTPRLEEAAGARADVLGAGPPLALLILGDSAAAGVGVELQGQALSGQLVQRLSTQHTVRWQLVARNGHQLRDVLADATRLPASPCDVVIVAVGVNDATAGTSPANWVAELRQLVQLLRSRCQPRQIILTGVPPMQHFPALPQPLRSYMGWRAQRLNRASADIAPVLGINWAPIQAPAEAQDFMARDGFHPNARAYQHWADQLAALILREASAANPRGSRLQ